jgi:G:T-mismatch repair DNA endonuclease (very short patch repair protein)
MSLARKGKNYDKMYGKKRAKEIIKKKKMNAKTNSGYGMKNKNHSKEARIKMSESHKGNILSEKTKRKISEKLIGKIVSEETKEKMRNRIVSEETRKKLKVIRSKRIIPFKDTKIEVAMQDILKKNKIEFETHKNLAGQPDIFIEPNICIFCDGDYWHANPAKYKAADIMIQGKLAQQIWDKDAYITKELESKGYYVFRFWENEINSNSKQCFRKIKMGEKDDFVNW